MKEIMDASSMKRSLVRMAHEIVEKTRVWKDWCWSASRPAANFWRSV